MERSGAVGMMVLAVEMMKMMIPMKLGAMTVAVAMICPSRREVSPTDFSLSESFSFSLFSAPQRRRKNYAKSVLVIFRSRGSISPKGSTGGGPKGPGGPTAWPGGGPCPSATGWPRGTLLEVFWAPA